MTNFIKASFLLLAVLVAVTSCKKPVGFEYRGINNISLENVSMDRSTVLLNMVYYNPNNFGVNLKSVECDVYVDSSFIGKYALDTLMHIDRKAEFTIPTRMQVDMRNLLKGGLFALLGQKVQISVKGHTRVGKGGIFINVPFDFSGKYDIPLFR
jgi:LEA14-like dessication related protein